MLASLSAEGQLPSRGGLGNTDREETAEAAGAAHGVRAEDVSMASQQQAREKENDAPTPMDVLPPVAPSRHQQQQLASIKVLGSGMGLLPMSTASCLDALGVGGGGVLGAGGGGMGMGLAVGGGGVGIGGGGGQLLPGGGGAGAPVVAAGHCQSQQQHLHLPGALQGGTEAIPLYSRYV